MGLARVIQEFSKEEEEEVLHKEYELEITSTQLLEELGNLILNEDDYKDEIYDQYSLTQLQVQKLKPFLKELLKEDFEKYTYELGCYEEE
ncbi:hypothetical protein IQ37_12605 [Chryseobacterium piperi]|uniref:DUF7683 domain-containing protein n=1 Tax=Chryseobacterium piperi TaxID=558152 RepID=A0A086B8H8_9FLAO|nr:hypothetical protein [Chryseobacterium piperi]ASW74903.1 hypothetical protein CJF12_11835 [Chryseobacterium piperi]KFF25242.1 hypothetical protein IQ37_12605 [Chryseobacterium piperi]